MFQCRHRLLSAAMILRYLIALLPILLFLAITPSRADWINLSGAETSPNIVEVYVEENRVRIILEAYIGDLEVFNDLVPDSLLKRKSPKRDSVSKRTRRFSSQTLRVVTETGEALPATLLKVEPRLRKERFSPLAGMINPITRRRVAKPPADKRVLYAELSYKFGQVRPKTLTLVPPLDDKGRARVTIGFIVYHKAVPVIDFRYLGAPAKLTLNWDDPWYSRFDNPNLKRHHKDALMSFLYVEPREVRHEVLVRVRDLQEWTDLGLKSGATISADEQARVKDRARAYLATRNPLKLDGALSQPSSSRAEFLKISLAGLQVVEGAKPLDVSTAIIGVILTYPIKRLPQHISIQWELFNRRIDRVPTTAIDPAGPLSSFVTSGEPKIEWRNFLHKFEEPKVLPIILDAGHSIGVPAVSIALLIFCFGAGLFALRPRWLPRRGWVAVSVLGGVAAALFIRVAVIEVKNPLAGPPDEKTTAQIVMRMLKNVNHALVEKEPGALRQALEIFVDEDRLEDVRTELARALAIKVPGGGIARVEAIQNLVIKDIADLDGYSGFRALAGWTARASAGHWGHAHRRTIRFQALMELAEVGGVWKLIGLTVVDAKLQK